MNFASNNTIFPLDPNFQQSQHFTETFLLFSCGLFLLAVALDGPLRYFLALSGVPVLVYIPKVLLISSVIFFALYRLIKGHINTLSIWTGLVVIYSTTLGFVYIDNPVQVGFGLWVLLPILPGIAVYTLFSDRISKLSFFVMLVFFVTVSGVLLDIFIDYPWTGFTYFVGAHEITASRQWYIFDIDRLAGFARLSGNAASILAVSGFFLLIYSNRTLVKIVVWILTGICIILTTSKSMIAIYLILTAFYFLSRFILPGVWAFLLLCVFMIGCILPFSSMIFGFSSIIGSSGESAIFETLNLRIMEVWPGVIDMLKDYGNLFLGRGIGGAGVPQEYFEPSIYYPVDNFYLYVYCIVGMFGVLFMSIFLFKASFISYKANRFDKLLAGWLLIFLIYGITNNVLQAAYLAFTFGIILSRLFTSEGPAKTFSAFDKQH